MNTLLDKLSHSAETSTRPGRTANRRNVPAKLPAAITTEILALFNTIRYPKPLPDAYSELRASLLTYGLPVFHEQDNATMAAAIAETVKRNEPRLKHVQVVADKSVNSLIEAQSFLVQAESINATHDGLQTLVITADRQRKIEEQDLK